MLEILEFVNSSVNKWIGSTLFLCFVITALGHAGQRLLLGLRGKGSKNNTCVECSAEFE